MPGTTPAGRLRIAPLTPRELDVLKRVARGLTNREISESLHISDATTKTHISNLLSKLQARDRVGLVIAAYESGLVTTPE
jgi:DNA-binding NarL/FixJ family response regulator